MDGGAPALRATNARHHSDCNDRQVNATDFLRPTRTAAHGTIQHWRRILLHHAAGHEAADRDPQRTLHWPNHRPARPVRLGDNSIIGDVDPFVIEMDAIMAVAGFPIDVG